MCDPLIHAATLDKDFTDPQDEYVTGRSENPNTSAEATARGNLGGSARQAAASPVPARRTAYSRPVAGPASGASPARTPRRMSAMA